jgi:hypothetical protein
MDLRTKWMKCPSLKDGDLQCIYCGHWNGDHHDECPKTPGDIEVWKAGLAAGEERDDCYAEVGSTYWLGWMMACMRRVACGG